MHHDNQRQSLLVDSLRAHMMKFSRPLSPAYGDTIGGRMLVAFIAVGVILFYSLRITFNVTGIRGLPVINLLFVIALLAAFLVAQTKFLRASTSDIGLRTYTDWTRQERLYFLQTVPAAIALFIVLFREHLVALLEQHGVTGFVFFSVLTGFIWGVVQEFLYRGWLQTELTRRFGSIPGLLAANAVFTFGPLHLYYLFGSHSIQWGGLAAIFGIGLVFGVIYLKSGNLWFPAIFHGLWPLNMT